MGKKKEFDNPQG